MLLSDNMSKLSESVVNANLGKSIQPAQAGNFRRQGRYEGFGQQMSSLGASAQLIGAKMEIVRSKTLTQDAQRFNSCRFLICSKADYAEREVDDEHGYKDKIEAVPVWKIMSCWLLFRNRASSA